MTNFERWHSYMSGYASPESFVDFGFYYLISASLQRRVWYGPSHNPLFGNIYPILVAEPGVGKGLVIKQVANFLRHHKLENPKTKQLQGATPEEKTQQILENEEFKRVEEEREKDLKRQAGTSPYEKPLLIPVAADATTYEALVKAMAKSLRFISVIKKNPDTGENKLEPYIHSSLCFCLEEISSLFRKRTEDLVHFLIQAYDCGDYTYDTKTQGKDRIMSCCLNFFGGTTPGFLQEVFDDRLLTEGFASRCFFIFEERNRNTDFDIPDLAPEQLDHKKVLIDHIYKLTKLYGRCEFTSGAKALLNEWWIEHQTGNGRINASIKLNPYYARKKAHLIKMSMVVHFGEHTDNMIIAKDSVEKAMQVLEQHERKMHHCLGLDTSNPLSIPSRKIIKYLAQHNKPFTFKELLVEFWEELPGTNQNESLRNILDYLEMTGKVKHERKEHPLNKQMMMYYMLNI